MKAASPHITSLAIALTWTTSFLAIMTYIQTNMASSSHYEDIHTRYTSQEETNSYKIPAEDPDIHEPLQILSWTRQSGHSAEGSHWWSPGQLGGCGLLKPWMRCEYTADRRLYNSSEAVLFRARRLAAEGLPSYRQPHQKWIFYEYEPPYKVWPVTNLHPYRRIFNLTSTFTFDSDVPLNLQRNVSIAPNKQYQHRLQNITFHQKKSRLVAWFVSCCKSQSQREAYVRELQRHIPVDIYGQCGPLRCGSHRQPEREFCDSTLLSGNHSYKFYLSFENSLCDDYVTEKLWRLLKHDVLQITMGGVHYDTLIPKRTYLDVKDFTSPRALAEFLYYLDSHPLTYDAYIRRKKSLRIQVIGHNEPYHCRLCRYLHQHRHETQIAPDLAAFWGLRTRCHHPKAFYRSNSKGIHYHR